MKSISKIIALTIFTIYLSMIGYTFIENLCLLEQTDEKETECFETLLNNQLIASKKNNFIPSIAVQIIPNEYSDSAYLEYSHLTNLFSSAYYIKTALPFTILRI